MGRIAAVLLPFGLAACQSLFKPSGACDDGGCPHTICDPKVLSKPTMHAAASDLDHLEKHIDWHGSVVPKVPDVWGQARLTLYREQFEQEMFKDLGTFELSLQGSVARQDQAFLVSATALSASLETPQRPFRTQVLPAGRFLRTENGLPKDPSKEENFLILKDDRTILVPPATPTPAITGLKDEKGNNVVVPGTPALPPTPSALGVVAGTGVTSSPSGIDFVGAPGFNVSAFQSRFLSPNLQELKLGLEPERYLEQKKRYLDLLAQIRRTNEGDDTADSPGYQIGLFRIPVSVLPGKHTDKGHGAEVTMTLTPVLGDDLLPTTFRGLVVNDLVYQLGFPIAQALNPGDNKEFKDFVTPDNKVAIDILTQVNDYLEEKKARDAADFLDRLPAADRDLFICSLDAPGRARLKEVWPKAANQTPSANGLADNKKRLMRPYDIKVQTSSLGRELSTRLTVPALSFATGTDSRTAVPTSQLVDVYGTAYSFEIAFAVRQAFERVVQRQGYAHLPDVQAYLKEELNAAYELLSNPKNAALWEFCSPNLVQLIRTQAWDQLDDQRRYFRQTVAGLALHNPKETDRRSPPQLSLTAALAWGIVVDAALLTDKTCKDMKSSAAARNAVIPGAAEWLPLYLPCPPAEVRATFNQYVRVRWPIHVFALDPAVQEQNLADRLSTRRELQLALSLAFSHGFMNFSQLTRYARRLEAEYETVDLNRTQVGFAHGSDTFGWRFYPRFQTPDTPGNLEVIARDLIAGGPNRSQLLRERRLEPGPRECVALVIMPSFVPAVQLDTTSNFFGLANPKHKVFDHTQAVKLGKTVQAIKTAGCGLTDANCYRDGDAARLVKRAEQLEARLPLQTVTFPVPTEGAVSGFGLFNTSTTSLAPELFGFYGAPGADATKRTTLFLVGDHFSPLRTRVIVGNKAIALDSNNKTKLTMISRQVVQVEFEPDFIPLNAQHLTVHVATPYGVSRELLVPLVKTADTERDGYYLTSRAGVAIEYKTTEVPNSKNVKAEFTAVGGLPVVIQARFATGVVPKTVRVGIEGVSDGPTGTVTATATAGEYRLDDAAFKSLLKAWFEKRVKPDQEFASAAEVEAVLLPAIQLTVTPADGDTTLGTTQKVNGLLPVTPRLQPPAVPPATNFPLDGGAKVEVECELEVVDKKFKLKGEPKVTTASLTVRAVPTAGAPAKVTLSIAGLPKPVVEISGTNGVYTADAAAVNAMVGAWVKVYVGTLPFDTPELFRNVVPKTLRMQLTPGGSTTPVLLGNEVTVIVKTPGKP